MCFALCYFVSNCCEFIACFNGGEINKMVNVKQVIWVIKAYWLSDTCTKCVSIFFCFQNTQVSIVLFALSAYVCFMFLSLSLLYVVS